MPQRHKLTDAEKRTQEKIKKEKAYAFYDRGAGAHKSRPKPAPPAAGSSNLKKSEGIRRKYTPTGLQSLVDVMGKKKKAK